MLRDTVKALFTPPFKFDETYIYDSKGEMVADSDCNQDVEMNNLGLRLRGWGRLTHMDNAEALHDETGEQIVKALNLYWNDIDKAMVRVTFGVPNVPQTYFNKEYSIEELIDYEHFNEISDNPFYKDYRIIKKEWS